MSRLWKFVLPIVVVLFALSVAIAMILSREQPASRVVEPPVPLIRRTVEPIGSDGVRPQRGAPPRPRTSSSESRRVIEA